MSEIPTQFNSLDELCDEIDGARLTERTHTHGVSEKVCTLDDGSFISTEEVDDGTSLTVHTPNDQVIRSPGNLEELELKAHGYPKIKNWTKNIDKSDEDEDEEFMSDDKRTFKRKGVFKEWQHDYRSNAKLQISHKPEKYLKVNPDPDYILVYWTLNGQMYMTELSNSIDELQNSARSFMEKYPHADYLAEKNKKW